MGQYGWQLKISSNAVKETAEGWKKELQGIGLFSIKHYLKDTYCPIYSQLCLWSLQKQETEEYVPSECFWGCREYPPLSKLVRNPVQSEMRIFWFPTLRVEPQLRKQKPIARFRNKSGRSFLCKSFTLAFYSRFFHGPQMPLREVLNLDEVLSLSITTISKLFIHDSHKSEVSNTLISIRIALFNEV